MLNKPIHMLITAGPTREYLDPVRYLSNDSSGQMGFSLAKAARQLGMKVTLVAGPVNLDTPLGAKRIDVVSAREMRAVVLKQAPSANIIIMCAAVADWRPTQTHRHKIKKTTSLSHKFILSLTENPDILTELGKKKKSHQMLVGFALETSALKLNAAKKLKKKNCDWIVANSAKTIGASSAQAILINREGRYINLPQLPKEDLAVIVLSHILG